MGKKVHPIGLRLGMRKDHYSVWYADRRNYPKNLNNDLKVRSLISDRINKALISSVHIERLASHVCITIHTSRPGIVIGKKGEDVGRLRHDLTAIIGLPVQININEVMQPELDACIVAHNIAEQISRRIMFRRAMKRSIQNAIRLGAKGIKIQLSGRISGAEIARTEWCREGRVPLHTLRADIDYATSEAHTTYGVIGVKVWIFKGNVTAQAYKI